MALGMKKWLGIVASGAVFLALWQLPPSALPARIAPDLPTEQLRFDELSAEYRVTAEVLHRVKWSDSLTTLTLATAEDDVAFGLPPNGLEPALIAQLESLLRDEISRLPRRGGDVVFGYFHQPTGHGAIEGVAYNNRPRTETYAGTRNGTDYCLQVKVLPRALVTWIVREIDDGSPAIAPYSDRAGVCRYFITYGMPGPEITSWLRAGGARLATERGTRPTDLAIARRIERVNRAFGFDVLAGGGLPIETDQCRAGLTDACEAVFLAPAAMHPMLRRQLAIVERSPVLSIPSQGAVRTVTYDESYMIADLEAEFGAEAFQRFWTADADVATAFEDAFGVRPGEWMASWVQSVAGERAVGPGLTRATTSGSVLFVALAVGLAFMWNRRREVV